MSHPIPDEALDDRLGFVGTSGSGKTYAAKGCVERLLAKGNRVVVVDPLDVWFGLRLSVDGGRPGFPIAVLGGRHGDLPLGEHSGALIGATVATSSESVIVSLNSLKTSAARQRFMAAFLDALYEHTDPDRQDPYHAVFDEADLWAPQKPMGQEAMLCHLMEEIVRRGRVRGFIPWLISQRPAVINKNVLSQVDGLITMKLTASQDRDALGAWIEGQADRDQAKSLLAALPKLARGNGVVWIPGRDILTSAVFPANATFDSSRTPARGEVRRDTALAPLDLAGLRAQLAALEAAAAAKSDSRKQTVAATNTIRPATEAELDDFYRRGFAAGVKEHRERLMPMFAELQRAWKGYRTAGDDVTIAMQRVIDELRLEAEDALSHFPSSNDAAKSVVPRAVPSAPPRMPAGDKQITPSANASRRSDNRSAGTAKANAGESAGRSLLAALASQGRITAWSNIAIAAGMRSGNGHFYGGRKWLVTNGLVHEEEGGVAITEAGVRAAGGGIAPVTLAELVEIWTPKLRRPGGAMLAYLANGNRSRTVTVDEMAAALGIKPGNGHWYGGVAAARDAGLIEQVGNGFQLTRFLREAA